MTELNYSPNRRNPVAILVGLLVAVLSAVIVWGLLWQKTALERLEQANRAELGRLASAQQDALETLQKESAVLRSSIEQQKAVLHRALGKVIPIELPAELTNRLSTIDATLRSASSWPADADAARVLVQQVNVLTREIPAWAESDFLPQLNRIRWGSACLVGIRQATQVAGSNLLEVENELAQLQEAVPDGAGPELVQVLATQLSSIRLRLDGQRLAQALAEARQALASTNRVNLLQAWEDLGSWTNSPGSGELVSKTRQQLRHSILRNETESLLAMVNSQLLLNKREVSVSLRQLTVAHLHEVLSQHRVLLASNDDLPSSLKEDTNKLLVSLEKEGQSLADERRRDYQRWALSEIKLFNRRFDEAKVAIKGLFDRPNYETVQNLYVDHLLPISPAHLDTAVGELYRQARESAWRLLENEKDRQTRIAEQEAVVSKRLP